MWPTCDKCQLETGGNQIPLFIPFINTNDTFSNSCFCLIWCVWELLLLLQQSWGLDLNRLQ